MNNKIKICLVLLLGMYFLAVPLRALPQSAPGTAGGIGDALLLRDVVLSFAGEGSPTSRVVLPEESLPSFSATLHYRGAGVLIGRWEVAIPGQARPGILHRVPEFALNAADRSTLDRFRVLSTFQESLAPIGRHVVNGPAVNLLPRDLPGRYTVLMRIASISTAAATNPPQPGLSIPVLEYTVLGVVSASPKP